jgi:hypothetical protein
VPSEEPVGAGETVAVRVTDSPAEAGLGAATSVVAVPVKVVMVSVSTLEVELAKAVLPEYAAVRLSDPAGKLVVEKVAAPDEFRVPLPSRVAPL